jgi:hypothetical protein
MTNVHYCSHGIPHTMQCLGCEMLSDLANMGTPKDVSDLLWESQQISAKLTAIIIDAAKMLSEAGRPDQALTIKQAAGIKVIGEVTIPHESEE